MEQPITLDRRPPKPVPVEQVKDEYKGVDWKKKLAPLLAMLRFNPGYREKDLSTPTKTDAIVRPVDEQRLVQIRQQIENPDGLQQLK
ncbi:MAG TPA: hypothetical protein VLH19_00045 [Patescibacteria group bacterium]|nr:hypothetical protein [Patescibacteria group bacterium]